MALGVASLPEGQAGRRHFVLGPAIGTFKDHHPFTPSDGDSLLSEEHFGLHRRNPRIQICELKGRGALDVAR
jgi:hypothetical protein